jgi:hypothetical protein
MGGVKLARFTTLEIRGILFCTIVTYTFYNPFLKINEAQGALTFISFSFQNIII